MDVPADILTKLRCSKCHGYLSCAPVFLQHNEDSICGRCSIPKESVTRNKQYEALAGLMKFPCKYQKDGCSVKLEFLRESGRHSHENDCEYRTVTCPLLDSHGCEWQGLKLKQLEHCQTVHKENMFNDSCTLTYDITKSSESTYLLFAFKIIFLLYTKVCVTTRKIYHSVQYLENPKKNLKLSYTLEIKNKKCNISETKAVTFNGCNYEDISIITDINKLLGILHGFDNTKFHISVSVTNDHRRDDDKKLMCAKNCGSEVTSFLYRDNSGWWCEHCVPPRMPCENKLQGCNFADIHEKRIKHEHFYCPFNSYCRLCGKRVYETTRLHHYERIHADIIHKLNKPRAICSNERGWQWCIIECEIGKALCHYWFTNNKFVMQVRTPLLSEQLGDYECWIEMIEDNLVGVFVIETILKRLKLELTYDSVYDWEARTDLSDIKQPTSSFVLKLLIFKK